MNLDGGLLTLECRIWKKKLTLFSYKNQQQKSVNLMQN